MQAFDAPEPGLEYKHRWAAFGIASRKRELRTKTSNIW